MPKPTTDLDLEAMDVGESRSIPAQCYVDANCMEVEKDQLFYKNWHYVCHANQLSQAGQFLSTQFFDQEILLVNETGAEIRAFYNVCPHRGHKLAEGCGKKRSLTCPYHKWTFSLDGQLKGARGVEGQQGFSKDDIRLKSIRVEQILDFVFINLDSEAESLDTYAAGLAEQLLDVIPDIGSYQLQQGSDYFGGEYAANWKVLMDNFMECYHCEAAHPSFADMMDIPAVTFSFHGNFSHQIAPSAMKESNAAFPLNLEEDAVIGHFWYLFPNTIFSVFPGVKSVSVSRCDPMGPEQTLRYFDVLVAPDANQDRLDARAEWGMAVVNEEDKSLCESVQVGMRQKGFTQGYYVIDAEKGNITEEGVRFFHRHYSKAMAKGMRDMS